MTLPVLLNYDEAQAYKAKIEAHVARELTGLVFGTLTKKWLNGERPTESFDTLFFVKVLEDAFASNDAIACVMRGESLLWPENGDH